MGQDFSAHLVRQFTKWNKDNTAYFTKNVTSALKIAEKLPPLMIFMYLRRDGARSIAGIRIWMFYGKKQSVDSQESGRFIYGSINKISDIVHCHTPEVQRRPNGLRPCITSTW
jgi:hypothetical protein